MLPGSTDSAGSSTATLTADSKRKSERYHCSRPRQVRILARPNLLSYEAYIKDFTRTGVGLIVEPRFEPGTILAIQLRSANTGLSCVLSAIVHHCTELANGSRLLGCRLSRPLSDEEALTLL